MRFREKISNLHAVFQSDRKLGLIAVLSFAIMAMILRFSTNTALIEGNMGSAYLWSVLILELITALLFSLNIALLWYKLESVGSVRKREAGSTLFGGMLGVVVAGCPSCGITLASYLGLASVLTALPFMGIELKIAGILILMYSTNYLAKHATVCETPLHVAQAKKRRK